MRLQVRRRRTIRRLPGGNSHSPNERAMQERGKRTGIDHKLGGFPIDRTIHIQIKIVAYLNWNSLQSAPVETRSATQNGGRGLLEQQKPVMIQQRLGWK